MRPVAGAFSIVSDAVTVATKVGDRLDVERLGAVGFQGFGGTADDATRFGTDVAASQKDLLRRGGVLEAGAADRVVAVFEGGGQVQASFLLRGGSGLGVGTALHGSELVGGAKAVLEHHPALRGIAVGGQWHPLA